MGVMVLQGNRLVDSDLILLDEQVREGDAVAGWRGDPTAWVNYDQSSGTIHVFARDARGKAYLAAQEHRSTPGWRYAVLERLVRGSRGAEVVIAESVANNAKVQADAEATLRDYEREELLPKLHHALLKDGLGVRDRFYMGGSK